MIKNRQIVYMICIICFFVSVNKNIYASGKKRIALLSFTAKNTSNIDADAVREFAEVSLYNTKAFEILERNRIELILKEQGLQMSGCADTSCAVRIGRFLSADMVVIGSVIKLDRFTITIKFVNVEKGDLVIADSINVDNRKMIQDAVNKLVQRIAEKVSAEHEVFARSDGTSNVMYDHYFRGVIPGWSQLYSGHTIKGYVFLGSFIISGAYATWAYWNYKKKKSDYESAGLETSETGFDKKYSDYKSATKTGRISLGLFAVVYIANWIDVLIFSKPSSLRRLSSCNYYNGSRKSVDINFGTEEYSNGEWISISLNTRL